MKLNKSAFALLGSCAIITLLSGCSTILCGPKQSVSINSKPAGAEVIVSDSHGVIVFQKTTPCLASLVPNKPDSERANYIVLIKKEGYAPVGVGLMIDPLTGPMWSLSPKGLDPKLIDQNAAVFHSENDLTICLKEQADLLAHH